MKAAWFNCHAGVAGDMTLGALLDAGADLDYVRNSLTALAVGSWTLDTERVQRAAIGATRVVITGAEDDTVSRTFRTIRALLEDADLPDRVRQRSVAVFTRLAEVEAAIHGTDIEHVHFHEVGGVDAILDIVGSCLALEDLGIDTVRCSPIATGHGTVAAAHGTLPVPAPAVIRLLEGAPTAHVDRAMELTTPTGAALMTTLSDDFGAMPAFAAVRASGYGAGTKDLPGVANCTQVVIGELAGVEGTHGAVVIEANIDDATGETLAYTVGRLIDAGAQDAWITPIVMKKGRPAHTVTCLTDHNDSARLAALLMQETGSFGVRSYVVSKSAAPRQFETVTVRNAEVRIKISEHRAKAEFDDAAAVAERDGVPVRVVIAEAEAAWRAGRS